MLKENDLKDILGNQNLEWFSDSAAIINEAEHRFEDDDPQILKSTHHDFKVDADNDEDDNAGLPPLWGERSTLGIHRPQEYGPSAKKPHQETSSELNEEEFKPDTSFEHVGHGNPRSSLEKALGESQSSTVPNLSLFPNDAHQGDQEPLDLGPQDLELDLGQADVLDHNYNHNPDPYSTNGTNGSETWKQADKLDISQLCDENELPENEGTCQRGPRMPELGLSELNCPAVPEHQLRDEPGNTRTSLGDSATDCIRGYSELNTDLQIGTVIDKRELSPIRRRQSNSTVLDSSKATDCIPINFGEMSHAQSAVGPADSTITLESRFHMSMAKLDASPQTELDKMEADIKILHAELNLAKEVNDFKRCMMIKEQLEVKEEAVQKLKITQATTKESERFAEEAQGSCEKVEASPNSYHKYLDMEIPPLSQEVTLRDANPEDWIFRRTWKHAFKERRIQLRTKLGTSKADAEGTARAFIAGYEDRHISTSIGGNACLDPKGTHILTIQLWVKAENTDVNWTGQFLNHDGIQRIRRKLSPQDKYANNKVRFTEFVPGCSANSSG